MNYLRFNELFLEFSAFIESLHALYLDTIVGYELLHERLDSHQGKVRELLGQHEYATKEFQDTCAIAYESLGGSNFQLISNQPNMLQGKLRVRVEPNGKNAHALGNLLIVSAYTYWEEYLRIEIGKAKGVLTSDAGNSEETRKVLNKEVVNDFWGDMRHLRNSIVHSLGTANSEMARCKVIKWFKPGDKIELNNEMLRVIFLCMGLYRNEVHKMQFRPFSIRIPDDKF